MVGDEGDGGEDKGSLVVSELTRQHGRILLQATQLDGFVCSVWGFFPSTCESKGLPRTQHSSVLRCQKCHDCYEQEVTAILKEYSSAFEDQDQPNLPSSWLHKPNMVNINDGSDVAKAKDDKSVLNSKITDLQKKWNDYCHRVHRVSHRLDADNHQFFPQFVGVTFISDRESTINQNGSITASPSQRDSASSLPFVPEPRNKDFLSKLHEKISKSEQLDSPSSITSVATDLVLATPKEPPSNEEEHSKEKSGFLQSKKASELLQPSNCSNGASSFDQHCRASSIVQKFDLSNYKSLCADLLEKVGRQEEAISAISRAIVQWRTSERRRGASVKGGIWLSFHGPDRVGKRRVAMALAELVYGSKENFIPIDLSRLDGINRSDISLRGKTSVDLIAGEISKKPSSVIFLDSVEKADFPLQSSLSQAIRTGKFPDSYGREFSTNNAIFVLTTKNIYGKSFSPGIDCCNFSEERVVAAQGLQMKTSVESVPANVSGNNLNGKVLISPRSKHGEKHASLSSVFVSKRKLDFSSDREKEFDSLGTAKRANRASNAFLDLNHPAEEIDLNETSSSSSHENDSLSDDSENWVENLFSSVDEAVNFAAFDFDALADAIIKDITKCFCQTIGSNCMLEIEAKAMDQILATAWVMEDRGGGWRSRAPAVRLISISPG
uniref:Uncharacterized protein n=1 Tax=Ananas comosus var. bracteatus TaxID=296719 RepID=A0A6V7NG82_ANACO|nr:unnamed protein product [Ananas comosus var. bracteatus]